MKLNEKIIEIRKKNGLSQEEFGEKINVSRQAVSKWESEQAKPDIDKIKEIAKNFNLSFDYLLNDEIDEEIQQESKKQRKISFKKWLNVIGIILTIYLLISIYKFITLYRIYKIADSFSENNYWMNQEFVMPNGSTIRRDVTKIGDKQIEEMYNNSIDTVNLKDEYDNIMPYAIQYVDSTEKIAYMLNYDTDKKMYLYSNLKDTSIDEEEWLQRFEIENTIKETTLSLIPSSFMDILLQSINPMSFVSNHEINIMSLNKIKSRIILSDDYLVIGYYLQTKLGETLTITLSYDYVQDHFDELEDPLEIYSNKIVK